MKKYKKKISFFNRLSKNWRRTPKLLKYTAITFFLLVVSIGIYSVKVQRARIAQLTSLPATPPSTSPFQYALKLDGQSYLTINNSESINPDINTGFTAEAWVKPADTTNQSMRIIGKSSGNSNGFSLSTQIDYIPDQEKYYVYYYLNVAQAGCKSARTLFNQQVYTSSTQVTSWHHVAAVIQVGGKFDLFVDGKRSTMNTNYGISNCISNLPIQIGANVLNVTNNDVNGYFRGEIDEMHLANYAKYKNNFSPSYRPTPLAPSSVVLYRFDNDLANANRDSYFAIAHGTGYGFVPSTIAAPRPSPRTSCRPRPACLDARPACKIPETDDMCPRPTNLRVIPTPSSGRPRAY